MDTDRKAYIAGLRELADRLDANPDCPLPYTGAKEYGPLQWVLDSREDVAAVTRLLRNVTKAELPSGGLKLTGSLEGLGFEVLTYGDVCERVEVGTTTETREVEMCSVCAEPLVESAGGDRSCPSYFTGTARGLAHDHFRPPRTRTVEVEVPRYEVRCPPSILAPAKPSCITYADDSGARCAHPTGHGGEHETYEELRARTLAEDRGVTA